VKESTICSTILSPFYYPATYEPKSAILILRRAKRMPVALSSEDEKGQQKVEGIAYVCKRITRAAPKTHPKTPTEERATRWIARYDKQAQTHQSITGLKLK
jgi:hypothetical protein